MTCMDATPLEELGLTQAETKIYLALLELGTTSAGPLLDRTGLQNSVTHLTLHKLVEKRLVTYAVRGKRRLYTAADPRKISQILEERKRRYEQMLPSLLKLQEGRGRDSSEVREGRESIIIALDEAFSRLKRGDEAVATPLTQEWLREAYAAAEKTAEKRGVKCRNIRDSPMGSMIVIGDTVLMAPPGESETAFIIESPQLAAAARGGRR